MENSVNIAALVGSNRAGRFAPIVAKWFVARAAARTDVLLDVVDLAQTPLPPVLPAFGQALHTRDAELIAAVSPRLARADGFVIITPEYNHSFPAVLKNAIDWHNIEWRAKPVGFVSYGGVSGGLRAVEQLRLVFAELHAMTIRDTVSFAGAWDKFDGAGRSKDPAADTAANVLLAELIWWARALRNAKAQHPYVV
jgi:NAD(P)H-dependent FMN reductase